MLSEGLLKQTDLIEKVGTIPEKLLDYLGPSWRGGFVVKEQREQALDVFLRGKQSWGAELRDNFYHRVEMGHMVVVDGLDDTGNIMIRDPAHGERYEMTRENFLKHWSDRALFRKAE
jgi:filamentous hemagglutinin